MSERPAERVEAEEHARRSQSIEANREGFRKTIAQYAESLRGRLENRAIQSYTTISTLLEEGRKDIRHFSMISDISDIGREPSSPEEKAATKKLNDTLKDLEFYGWM